MIPAAESTPKPSSTPVFSLPPPCSFEDLYSSYQNEWDQQKKGIIDDQYNENTTGDLDIDTSVSGLEWVTLPSSNGDNSKGDAYLLACTGSGEVLVWKLAQSIEGDTNSDTGNNLDPVVLLKKHARYKICHDSEEEDGRDYDEKDGRDHNALNGICIVKVATTNFERENPTSNNQKGRKRRRPNNGTDGNEGKQQEHQLLLIVAGEGGLWSIPLLDVLEQPWEESISASTTSSQERPSSLLRLSKRSIQKVQTSQSSEEEEPQRLFALERDTNTLAFWNLAAVVEKHTTTINEIGPAPDAKIDLSRIFSDVSASTSKSKNRRKIQIKAGGTERATTMYILPSLAGANSGLSVLVGTDRSRLWHVPIANGDTGPKPRFFSLHEERKPSSEESLTKPGSFREGSDGDVAIVWRVTDVLATQGGTWWTVAAVATTKGSSNINNKSNKTGLLITWHAPTGMLIARQETREAITAILHLQQLYSAANEGAITVWNSPFDLRRRGRFWASPPSSKALAILCESLHSKSGVMAVAGVGDSVDLFVDHCRVQTVGI